MGTSVERLVGDRRERSESGRDASLGCPMNELLPPSAVRDQVGDGDDAQVVLLGKALEIVEARHRAILVDHLAHDPRRIQTRQTSEVDGSLGVTRAP